MNIWPFVFAASPVLEYRFVIQPDFIEGAQETQFREQLALEDTGSSEVRTLSVIDSRSNTIRCFYRAGPLLHDGEIQTDSVGRKLSFSFGFFSPDPVTAEESGHLIDRLRPFFDKSLASFLKAERGVKPTVVPMLDSSSPPAQQALKFDSSSSPAQQELKPVEQDLKPARASIASTAILGALLALSIGLAGWMFLENRGLEKRIGRLETGLTKGVADHPHKTDEALGPPEVSRKPDEGSGLPELPRKFGEGSGPSELPRKLDEASRPADHAKKPDEPSRPPELPKNINP
jgi:hypothetical protein